MDNNKPMLTQEEAAKAEILKLQQRSNWSLKKERRRLTQMLETLVPTSDEYAKVTLRLDQIESVIITRWKTRIDLAKVVGTLGLTATGLYLTYKIGDNGDRLTNQKTGRFAEGLRNLFK